MFSVHVVKNGVPIKGLHALSLIALKMYHGYVIYMTLLSSSV